MTKEEFRELVAAWCREDSSEAEQIGQTRSLIDFLEVVLFKEYEPVTVGTHGEFGFRLARWIGCADTDAQKRALFQMLDHLVFLGREQMKAGYLTAFSKNILHWLSESIDLELFNTNARADLEAAFQKTALTEITDSFRLGDFCRWNNLHGHSTRYTWEQHLTDWNPQSFAEQVLEFDQQSQVCMKTNLVLLEDFVGSGSQMEDAVNFACNLSHAPKVLLCPIVICPVGAQLARSLETRYENLTFSPVLELPATQFIAPSPTANEHNSHAMIRTALIQLHSKVRGTPGSWPLWTPPFGYRDTGAFFCKYDNCPDNTVPALHHRSDLGWEPLFYRTPREG